MGKKAFDWEGVNRAIKGANGISVTPYFNKNDEPPSKKQVDYIEQLLKDLLSNGVDVSWWDQITCGDWKRSKSEAWFLTRKLVWLRYSNGIPSGAETIYVNLCKHKETGKKIKYKTHHKFAAPKGYEFIGQLSREIKIPEAV